MPRSNRPRGRRPPPDPLPLRSASWTRTESASDGEWVVRSVSGSSSGRRFRCPGCDQEIPASVGHLVTWPAGEWGSVEQRRHWHVTCWQARGRRRPGGGRR